MGAIFRIAVTHVRLPLTAFFLALLSLSGLESPLKATTYDVGAGQPFVTIASLPGLQPGDVVNIHCGTYNEVKAWPASGTAASPITLQGVCSTARPIIDATGMDVSGNGGPRGVWEIQGSFYQIANLEFKNARNGDNGAGIRVMNASTTITNCKMDNNDMGFMSSTANVDNLLVQNSEIAFNGTGALDGQSHNVYLTSGTTVTFSFCYIHDSVSGENFKSRAHYVQLFYNYIADGAESEVEGVDNPDTAIANSNMTMIGNLLVSTPNRTVNITKFINFGQDVGGTHNGTLYLINNTLIAGSPTIGFLRSSAPNSAIVSINNIYFGSDTIVQPGFATSISGSNNWTPNTAVLPAGFTGTVTGTNPNFFNAALFDFHLTAGSPARDIALASPVYLDASGVSHSGVPVFEYVHPLSSAPRINDGTLDAGAFEFAGTATTVNTAPAGLSVFVDGTACTAPCVLQWTPGTIHTISASNQAGSSGTQYIFSTWSDGGAASHSVTAATYGAMYIAAFTTQYFLTTMASPSAGGTINPPSGWFNAGTQIPISAIPSAGYQFAGFTGGLSLSGTPQTLTLTAPVSVTADFSTLAPTGWYSAGGTWSNRKSITVNHARVAGSATLSNFPVLVSITDSNLQTTARTDGGDILFTASDGVTKLSHEVEQYNSATGQLTAWVNVPVLSPVSDIVLYLYYGNRSAANQQNAAGVWDSNYKGVWHLANGAVLSGADSIGNSSLVNSGAAAAAGKIGGGASFPSGQFMSAADNLNERIALPLTVEMWVKYTDTNNLVVFEKDGNNGYSVQVGYPTPGNLRMDVGGPWTAITSSAHNDGAWHHVVFVVSGAGNGAVYVDGVNDTVANAPGTPSYSTGPLYLGSRAGGYTFTGSVDEVRISNNGRTAAWIATEYNNQNAPGAFVSEGVQQNAPVAITVASLPAGLSLTVDSVACTSPCSFQWAAGSSHTVAAATQAGATGVQYIFANWSDGGAAAHAVTGPAAPTTYTATFITQNFLTTAASPAAGGSIGPASGWFNSGTTVAVSATPNAGYQFAGFSGALSGTTTPQNVIMTAPATVSANFTTGGSTGWYSVGGAWSNRKSITLNHAQVSGTTALSNFPVLVSITDANLQTTAKADGSDILFTASDGVTKLSHEVEQYNSATGQLTASVNVPVLSTTSDTVLYLYYGNPSAANQQNAAGVWDSNYKGVWHLANGAVLSGADSIGNSSFVNSGAAAVAGKIGGGASFPSGQFMSAADNLNERISLPLTVEMWVKYTDTNNLVVLEKDGNNGYSVQVGYPTPGNLRMDVGGPWTAITSSAHNDGAWHHVVFVVNGAGNGAVYVDGVNDTVTNAPGTPSYSTGPLYLGSRAGGYTFTGSVDEVRLSNNGRIASWIATEYNNQNAPGFFAAVGAQQNHP